MHRWGRFAGRQRYRCVGCSRTFSTYTGTALHYLKRVDRWAGFCRAMDRSLTIRDTARILGLHKDTVFRWRHRFLETLAGTERTTLTGEVVVEETSFPYCIKGARAPSAAEALRLRIEANRREVSGRRPRVWVLLARDARGHGAGRRFGELRPGVGALTDYLGPRVGPDGVLVGGRGRYSPLALSATRLGLRYRAPAPPRACGYPTGELATELRSWIRRFRGVATRYLENYLLWFRALGCQWSGEVWDLAAVGMD